MASRGTEVHALGTKLSVIAQTLHELKRIPHPSRRDFARFSLLNYDSLKAAWKLGRISEDLQEKIAAIAGFNISDPSWIDQNIAPHNRSQPDTTYYTGRDSVTNFRYMLRHTHGLAAEVIRIIGAVPELVDRNLLSFSVEDSRQGTRLDKTASLFLTMIIDHGYLPSGLIYGFRRVRLRLSLPENSALKISDLLARTNPVKMGTASLSGRGDSYNPEWFLEAQTLPLCGEYGTREDPLCSLEGFTLEDEFKAEVAVRPMDGSVIKRNGTDLSSNNKRRVLEALAAKRLVGTVDSQGWISLGMQTLAVIRGDAAKHERIVDQGL